MSADAVRKVGRPEYFLTERQIRDFRTTTWLLHNTKRWRVQSGGGSINEPSGLPIYQYCANFTVLTIRHTEIAAVVPQDPIRAKFLISAMDEAEDDDGPTRQFSDNCLSELAFSANADWSALPKNPDPTKMPAVKVYEEDLVNKLNEDYGSMARYMIKTTIGVRKQSAQAADKAGQQGGANTSPGTYITSVNWRTHVTNLQGLLQRASLCGDDKEYYCQRLEASMYVHGASNSKIKGRLGRGNDRGFFDKINVDTKQKDACSDDLKREVAGRLLDTLDNKNQTLKLLQAEIETLDLSIQFVAQYSSDDTDERFPLLRSATRGDEIKYDAETLIEFQSLVSAIFDLVQKAVEAVHQDKSRAFEQWINHKDTRDPKHVNQTSLLAMKEPFPESVRAASDLLNRSLYKSVQAMQVLLSFRRVFPRILRSNFAFAEEIKKAVDKRREQTAPSTPTRSKKGRRTKSKDLPTPQRAENVSSPLPAFEADSANVRFFSTANIGIDHPPTSPIAPPALWQDTRPSSKSSDPSEGEVFKSIELDLDYVTLVDDNDMQDLYAPEFEAIDNESQFADRAMKFVDLLCLHSKALVALLPRKITKNEDKVKQKILQTAEMKNVTCSASCQDHSMTPVKDFLASFKMKGGSPMGIEDRDTVLDALREKPALKHNIPAWESDGTCFGGNTHVEANILGLHLLSKLVSEQPQAAMPLPEGDKEHFLELPAPEDIDAFKAPPTILPISKRSCPSCQTLIHWLQQTPEFEDLSYPGYHADWTAVSMANWMPKAAGEAMIAGAELTLRKCLEQCVADMRRARRAKSKAKSDDTEPDGVLNDAQPDIATVSGQKREIGDADEFFALREAFRKKTKM